MTEHNAQARLLAKLRGLRLALRGRLFAEGLARVLMALAGLVVVTFAFDYTLRLDRPLRLLILAICGAGVLAVVLRRLVMPQVVAMGTRDLAMLVERRYRQLGDRLISALQLADRQQAVAVGMSSAMIDRVMSEAETQAGELKFNALVDKRRLWKAWGIVLALAVVLGGVAAARGDLAGLWYRRNILMENVDWPQETYLRVFAIGPDGRLVRLLDVDADGTITHQQAYVDVLRGSDLEIFIETTAASEAPDMVMLHAWYPSEGDTEEKLPRLGDDAAQPFRALRTPPAEGQRHYYRKTFPAVSEAFRFYVTGGDDRRDARTPHELRLLAPPALRDLSFTVAAPAYMRQAQTSRFDGDRGMIRLHLGSTVTLQARSTKDLAWADLMLGDNAIGEIAIVPDTDNMPRAVQGVFQVTGENKARTERLRIVLRDTDGYTNATGQQYPLEVIPDRPPEVSVASRGVRTVVAPTVYIPLVATARDDIGIEGVQLRYRLSRAETIGEGEDATIRAVPGEPVDLETPLPPDADDLANLSGERVLDIRPMKLPVGSEIVVVATARDLLPAEYDGPNTTDSRQLVFTIISRDELMGQLVAKQKEVRMEFFQASAQHQLALGRSETLLAELAGGVPADLARQAGDARNKQHMVAIETLKAADTLDAVATELEFNRLGKADDWESIRTTIVLPLRQMLRMMDDVQTQLDTVIETQDPEAIEADMAEIVLTQQRIAEQMAALLKRMQKLENRVELIRRLEGMMKLSRKLKDAIDDETEGATDSIFEPKTPAGE